METKFTQGKWNLVTSKESGSDVCASNGEIICQVFDATGKSVSEMDYETMVANAKLIAAAPEMLEALIFCKSVIEQSGMFELSERLAFEQAEKALKKATE